MMRLTAALSIVWLQYATHYKLKEVIINGTSNFTLEKVGVVLSTVSVMSLKTIPSFYLDTKIMC